jgi:hypothetical protein
MKLYIRDDDTSFFTQVSEIEEAYNDIWEFGPINLAVIPYSVQTFNQGELGLQYQEQTEYYIGDNYALVEYLKKKISENKVNIMLHGYNHYYKESDDYVKYPFGIPEFLHCKNHYDRIKHGKDKLEELFNIKIKWFIPPSNKLTLETIKACDRLGLNIPLVFNLKNRFWNVLINNPGNFIVNRLNKYSNINNPLIFENHVELLCTSFTSVTDFSNIKKVNGNNVIATHYWELNKFPSIKGEILRELKRSDFKLNSLNDFFK